ncbi:MAG: RDD family protein [Candidatus Hydrogenedentes bacterium]|nr:RDD family protein [Candidatus Hydrogenedentota bacterium]
MSPNSDKQWFYAKARQRFGPVTARALAQLYEQGEVQDSDLVWAPELGDQWQRAEFAKERFLHAPPPPPPRESMTPVDRYPSYSPQADMRAPARFAPRERDFEYASFFARFAAIVLDSIILFFIMIPVGILVYVAMGTPETQADAEALGNTVNGLSMLIYWLYFAGQESGSRSATFGKRAMGLYVTDLNGDSISFWRATARHFSKLISSLLCLAGYFFVFFTPRKQALHDMIAGCVVVK